MTKLPEAARDCQELPEPAENYQELPEAARNCQKLPEIANVHVPSYIITTRAVSATENGCFDIASPSRLSLPIPGYIRTTKV